MHKTTLKINGKLPKNVMATSAGGMSGAKSVAAFFI